MPAATRTEPVTTDCSQPVEPAPVETIRLLDGRLSRSRQDAARMLEGFALTTRDETDLERLSGDVR
jgi:hypothetical protein